MLKHLLKTESPLVADDKKTVESIIQKFQTETKSEGEMTSEQMENLSISGDAPPAGDSTVAPNMSENSDSPLNNPVGKLQEVCMKKHWNPPIYESVDEVGLPHERVFKYVCYLQNMQLQQFGEGKSKKLAKRESAVNMLNLLHEQNLDKVDEIMDNLPRNMNKKISHNIVSEIVNSRSNNSRLNKHVEKLWKAFFFDLQADEEKITKLDVMFPEMIKFIQANIQDNAIPNAEAKALELAKVIECDLSCSIHSEKSLENKFVCWSELVATDSKYENIAIVSSYGDADDLQTARERSSTRCIVTFLLLIIDFFKLDY